MKTICILLLCLLSLSFFLGCEETDTRVGTHSINTEKPPLWRGPAPSIDITHYPEGWVRLTESDIAALLAGEIPQQGWDSKNHAHQNRYHAALLKQFGDIPQVRFVIEVERNSPENYLTEEMFLTYLDCLYFLDPNEHNKREFDRLRGNMMKDEPIPDPPPVERPRPLTVQDVEAEHAALLKKHGDIPQVQIVTDFQMKAFVQGQPVTFDEIFAFRQAKFELDPDEQPNRVIFEAYLQAKANGLPLHTVDERKVIEEWLNDKEAD